MSLYTSLEIRTELEIRNDMKNSTISLSNLESIRLTPVFAVFADFFKSCCVSCQLVNGLNRWERKY